MHLIKETICERQRYENDLKLRRSFSDEGVLELRTRLQCLLKEKKLQSARQIKESLYIQTILSQKVVGTDDVKQFNEISRDILSLYSEEFQQQLTDVPIGKDLVNSSIFLFIRFFEVTGNSSRSAEALNMYQKRLCEKDAMLPTLLSWFVEWTRKSYMGLLKEALQEVNLAIETLQPRQTVQPKAAPVAVKQKLQEVAEQTQRGRMVRSDTIAIMKGQLSSSLDLEEQRFVINKQLFYGSFVNEMSQLYRFHAEVLPDLDLGYIKSLKKMDNRKEIVKRLPKVVDVFVASMQVLPKQSIDHFITLYLLKYPEYSSRLAALRRQRQKQEAIKQKRVKSPKKDYSNLLSGNSQTLKAYPKASSSISKLKYPEQKVHCESESQKKQLIVRDSLSRPLLPKKFVDINLPSIKSRNLNSEDPECTHDFRHYESSVIYPQQHIKNHQFQFREDQVSNQFAEVGRQEQRRMRQRRESQRERYASLSQHREEPQLSYEIFSFGRKSTKLEDLVGHLPAEDHSHVFCLPRLVKN